jgi:Protein of unknown function DUF262
MNKEELIKEYLKKPFEIGDTVNYCITWAENQKVKVKGKKELQDSTINKQYKDTGKIAAIFKDKLLLKVATLSQGFPNFIIRDFNNNTIEVPIELCIQNTNHVGYNPVFAKEIRIQEYRQELESLLTKVYGFSQKFDEIKELNWNPIFETENGVVHYQRDFCWILQDKQLLIESIYNDISIGKFVFRKRGWDYAVKYKDDPLRQAGYNDVVDGKQRLNALVEFIENKFPDLNGYYYKDFSEKTKRRFKRFSNLTVAELPENTTDAEVKEIFLKINYSGVQMSMNHLNFVKSINL